MLMPVRVRRLMGADFLRRDARGTLSRRGAAVVAQRHVRFSADPKSVKEDGRLSGHSDFCPLPCLLSPSLCELQSPPSQVAVFPEGTKLIVRRVHQHASEEWVS